MTKQSDALFAFEGVMSSLRDANRTEFIFRLPEVIFNEALLWLSRQSHCKRKIKSNTSSLTTFPSWSWVGWNTRSDYRLVFVGFIRPEFDWYLINRAGEATQLSTRGSWDQKSPEFIMSDHQVVRPQVNSTWSVSSHTEAPERNSITRRQLGTSLLACWTSFATFWLLGDNVEAGESDESLPFQYNLVYQMHSPEL